MASLYDPKTYSDLFSAGKKVLDTIRKIPTPQPQTGVLNSIRATTQIGKPIEKTTELPSPTNTGMFDMRKVSPLDLKKSPISIYGQGKTPIEDPVKAIKNLFGYVKSVPEATKITGMQVAKSLSGLGRMAAETETPLQTVALHKPRADRPD